MKLKVQYKCSFASANYCICVTSHFKFKKDSILFDYHAFLRTKHPPSSSLAEDANVPPEYKTC